MDSLLNWNGYGLAGLVVSLLGAGATIWFAWNASKSALSAKDFAEQAAADAKRTLHVTNTISELQKLENIFQHLKSEMENENWKICAKGCSEAHVISGRIKSQSELSLSVTERSLLKSLHSQSLKLELEFRQAHQDCKIENGNSIQSALTSLSSKSAELSVSVKGKANARISE